MTAVPLRHDGPRWTTQTRIESELMLVARDQSLHELDVRLLVMLHNDVRSRADSTRYFPFDTRTYARVLGVDRMALSRSLARCAEHGWIDLGPRTSRCRTVRLSRLAQ